MEVATGPSAGGGHDTRMPASHRRRLILAAALDRFGDRGFRATSMEEIARGASVTKPVIYQHFRSKRDLYRNLLESVGSHLIAAIKSATDGIDGPKERLAQGMDAFFEFIFTNRRGYTLLFGAGPKRDGEFSSVVESTELAIADLVAASISGTEDESTRHFLAFSLVGLAQGAARSYIMLDPEDPSVDYEHSLAKQRAKQAAELLWSGLRHLHPSS
jgi:AcrR family transcriptional regulator